jgi:hypothetical protein
MSVALTKNEKVLAWVNAELKAQSSSASKAAPTRALFARMLNDPVFVGIGFDKQFNAYVDRYYFMSDDDGDLQNLRFKNDPYIPW